MSEEDANKWINLNICKVNFIQTHLHKYGAPITSQVEELERTA